MLRLSNAHRLRGCSWSCSQIDGWGATCYEMLVAVVAM